MLKKIIIVFIIVFVLRFLFIGSLLLNDYCKKNIDKYLGPYQINDALVPTQSERDFLKAYDSDYQVSGYTRALLQCKELERNKLIPGLF